MKVLFINDFKDHKEGEITLVSDGYALNTLFPAGCIIQATDENINNYMNKLKKIEDEKNNKKNFLQEINKKEFNIIHIGTIFSKGDILKFLNNEYISYENIIMKNITQSGEYNIKIKLDLGTASFKLNITLQNGSDS